jgi:hypothetical protein
MKLKVATVQMTTDDRDKARVACDSHDAFELADQR